MRQLLRLLSPLLVVALALGAAACGDDDKEETSDTTLFDINEGDDDENKDDEEEESDDEEGEAGDVDPDEWAAEVCGSMGDWLQAIQDAANNLGSPSTPEEGKEVFTGFLDLAATETGDLVDEIDDAGAPDVPDGEAVASALKVGLNRAKTIFEDARASADTIPTDDPDAFQQALTEIQGDIEEGSTELSETFDRLETEFDVPELDRAFQNEPACQEFESATAAE